MSKKTIKIKDEHILVYRNDLQITKFKATLYKYVIGLMVSYCM